MKRSIFALTVITLLIAHCNNPSAPASPEFSPPAWTIGTWKDYGDVLKYEFTTNNIIMVYLEADIPVDFKKDFVGGTLTEDVSNENEYTISATYPHMKQVYRFVKTSATTLDYNLIMTDDTHPEGTSDRSPIPLIKE